MPRYLVELKTVIGRLFVVEATTATEARGQAILRANEEPQEFYSPTISVREVDESTPLGDV